MKLTNEKWATYVRKQMRLGARPNIIAMAGAIFIAKSNVD